MDTQETPTVMLVLTTSTGTQEYAALSERGEVVVVADINPPDDLELPWSDAGLADPRGGGGWEGYRQLRLALEAAELNARLVGLDIRRVKDR